jgi:hypothetical protein
MANRVKLCFQVAWLTSAFAVLVMSFNFCAATDQACFDAGGRMFLVMVVLSFPAGILCVLVALFFLGPASSDQLNEYVIFWWIMTGAGYLQWFVVAPKLFAKPKFTSLGLGQGSRVERVVVPEFPTHHTTSQIAPLVSSSKPSPQIPKPKRVRLIRAYDNRGRTPLERALWTNSTNASS